MYKMIDLFAGIGGVRLGFENNNIMCVASSEIDSKASETYKINFGEIPLGDITKIDSFDLPDFHIVSAGFPCQPFSIGGFRKGFEDARGTLFFEVARIIAEKKPEAFFLENVAGIINHDNGKTLKIIENILSDLGYTFAWKLMNAKDYGIPQNRNRWYCIGFRNDLNIVFEENSEQNSIIYNFPTKTNLEFTLNEVIDDVSDDKYKISEIAGKNINKFLDDYVESPKFNKENILIANDIRPSRCGFKSDGISPCLTAKMGTGGNNIPVIVDQFRKMTVKECLKIMGFPETFKMKENTMSSYKQIGNSVVVSIIDKLAGEMTRVLDESRSRYEGSK